MHSDKQHCLNAYRLLKQNTLNTYNTNSFDKYIKVWGQYKNIKLF